MHNIQICICCVNIKLTWSNLIIGQVITGLGFSSKKWLGQKFGLSSDLVKLVLRSPPSS